MVLTRDQEIQQGDTQRFVIPVLDGDDPDVTFYANIGAVSVSFAIADSLAATDALYVAPDEQIAIKEFSEVKVGSDAFDFSDTDAGEGTTIPNTQEIVVVDIPASVTETFGTESNLRYQCRFEDPNLDSQRLTPVKGALSVEAATPFSE